MTLSRVRSVESTGKRLGVRHVEGGAGDPPGVQRTHEGVGVDQAAARRVDDEDPVAHGREGSVIEKVCGVGGQWCVQ